MQVYGKEIDFKIGRLKDAAALETAITNMGEAEEQVRKETKLVKVMSRMNDMFRQFFIDATGVDVLEECGDLEEAKRAYYEFLGEVGKQKDALINFSASDIK